MGLSVKIIQFGTKTVCTFFEKIRGSLGSSLLHRERRKRIIKRRNSNVNQEINTRGAPVGSVASLQQLGGWGRSKLSNGVKGQSPGKFCVFDPLYVS